MLALGVIGTGLAFLIFYTLIAEVGAAKASLVAYLAPGFALAYGAVFLAEAITGGAIGGLGADPGRFVAGRQGPRAVARRAAVAVLTS